MYEFWSETLLQYYTAMKSYVYHSLSKIFEGNHLEHCIHSSMDNTFAQLVSILDNILELEGYNYARSLWHIPVNSISYLMT